MQAVILAGGRGQRLRPITDYTPKPLAPLANVPILEWQLRYLERFKITDVVVCSGYKTDMISHYLGRRGRGSVAVSAEEEALGTGGAIRNASPLIDGEEFVVMNGGRDNRHRYHDGGAQLHRRRAHAHQVWRAGPVRGQGGRVQREGHPAGHVDERRHLPVSAREVLGEAGPQRAT